ncbi:MAG TPA: glutamine synthetase family protein [Steroidobacteraceae bacterium]|nr:glutamine synthetase family protein [Steroidobacteraceae bacterium]
MPFIEQHDLWTDAQRQAALELRRRVEADGIDLVRLSFPDLHGILRGKSLLPEALPGALTDGCPVTSTLLLKDSSHRTVVPVFSPGAGIGLTQLQGASDVIMVPDPTTFRMLPWLPKTGWMLCDVYFSDGSAVGFAPRHLLRRALAMLNASGRELVTGLEVEFHILRLVNPRLALDDGGQPGSPPEVELIHQGYNHLTELRLDRIEPITDMLRRHSLSLGMELQSIELEFGPSQVEFVFRPARGIKSADDMVLFRSAVKQICRRHGYHASFMCRPSFASAMSSGWHLHQSLEDLSGRNLFVPEQPGELLSPMGRHYLAGLMAGAAEAVAFTTPTVNGYKRYRAHSLAPDRIAWGSDNRGAMLRVIGGANPGATRIENRIGEPAANPYLYIASQLTCGLQGVAAALEPPPPVDAPYDAVAAPLPSSLGAALDALGKGTMLREAFGGEFIGYYTMVKQAELRRYETTVTDWEMKEYFDIF